MAHPKNDHISLAFGVPNVNCIVQFFAQNRAAAGRGTVSSPYMQWNIHELFTCVLRRGGDNEPALKANLYIQTAVTRGVLVVVDVPLRDGGEL